MDSKDNLNSFLSLGYFLDYKNPDISFDLTTIPALKEELSQYSLEELQSKCKEIWYQTFEEIYQKGEHVVPISGGLDSRAILATLLKFTNASNIHTYTFGTTGTYDFEIGNTIGRKIGTNHRSFPLTDYKYSTDNEIIISKRTNHQTFLYHHPDLDLIDKHYKGLKIWSGAMMDWITGSYIPINTKSNLYESKRNIIKRGVYSENLSLVSDKHNIHELIDDNELIDNDIISFEEQLQIKNFLPKMEAPHILYEGFNYKIPAKNADFYSFFLSLNEEERSGQKFYRNFLFREFPDLFSLPIKSLHGLSYKDNKFKFQYRRISHYLRSRINSIYPIFFNPHLNYLDFNEGIRNREDINKVVHVNILDLKRRNIISDINIEEIYYAHMKRKANYAKSLILLSSLEIHLKAGKKI